MGFWIGHSHGPCLSDCLGDRTGGGSCFHYKKMDLSHEEREVGKLKVGLNSWKHLCFLFGLSQSLACLLLGGQGIKERMFVESSPKITSRVKTNHG